MKKILVLAACVLCTGMTEARRHNDDNGNAASCATGNCAKGNCAAPCAKKNNDCGATCNRTSEKQQRAATVKCPRTVTVYDEIETTQERDVVTTTCACPAPTVTYTEWSKSCCPNKKCGQCDSCVARRNNRSAEVVSTGEAKSSKKSKSDKADKTEKSAKANKAKKAKTSSN